MTQAPVSTSPRRPKLAELISDDIKRWIAAESLGEGDRLPNEKALMELYGSAKGTVREALKRLAALQTNLLLPGPRRSVSSSRDEKPGTYTVRETSDMLASGRKVISWYLSSSIRTATL